MARHETGRDDMLQEATALVDRAELAVPGHSEPVVFGFRRNGCASFLFGPDPVIQFNTRGELRRMYWNGRLVKAQRGQLVWMERVKNTHEVSLISRPFTVEESRSATQLVTNYLADLTSSLTAGTTRCLRQSPAGSDVLARLQHWLADHGHTVQIADKPHAL